MESRSHRGLILTFVVLLIIAAAYGGLRLAARWMAQGTWVAAPGEPTTPEELNAWYPSVPESENAALIYIKAFEARIQRQDLEVALPFYDAKLPPPGEPLPEAMRAAMGSYLAVEAEEIRLLHETAALPKSRYPVDLFSDEPWVDSSKLRYSVRDLCIEALVESEHQHGDAAVQALLAALAAAVSLRAEPTFMPHHVGRACFQNVWQVLERMLSQSTLTEAQLQALSTAVGSADTFECVSRGLVGSRCFAEKWFEHPSAYLDEMRSRQDSLAPPRTPSSRFSWGFYRWSGLADFEHARFNNLLREWQEARRKSFPGILDAVQDVQSKADAIPEWRARITRALMPPGSITRLTLTEADQRARISIAQTALALERFRLAKGMLPERLEDLAPSFLPEAFSDPFDGKALRYRRNPSGYVLYSIGMNLEDEDGSKASSNGREGDIVFEVVR
jgi:hypothetical protein